ncbi:MAG: heme-dependent oxidative N-demethylase family protein [Burkholderiaceae bacterium]
MSLHGVYLDRVARDKNLADGLRADDMERYTVVPRTVMINQWPEDLNWLLVDSTYPQQIARRLELLTRHGDMVIDRLPGKEVATAEIELRDMVADYLLSTYPAYFRREGDLVLCPLTGIAVDTGPQGADPMLAVALLASEDMLLLLPERRSDAEQAHYVLKSGALCFPNDWSLRSHFNLPQPADGDAACLEAWHKARRKSMKAARLGKTPYEIHDGHVSHYMQHFAARVDLFFAKMEPGMRTWRRNWGMRLSSELFLHADMLPADLPAPTAHNWEQYGYLRSEHETFTKLPHSQAVVFSIKTFLWKLSELVRNPVALNALLVANENLAPTMIEYRADSFPSFREFLARYATASLENPTRKSS